MSPFAKTLFSVALLSAGFGLASMFGPPELADQLAESLRPAETSDRWGALQPIGANDPEIAAWTRYEAAAIGSPEALSPEALPPEIAPPERPPALFAGDPAAATPLTEAPRWSPRPDPAIQPALAHASADGRAVPTAGWVETTAPIGWPATPAAPEARSGFDNNPPPVESWPAATQPPSGPPRPQPAASFNHPSPLGSAGFSSWGANTAASTPSVAPAQTVSTHRDDRSPVDGSFPSGWPTADASAAPATFAAGPLTPIAAPPVTAAEPPPATEPVRHVVRDGDTLTRLAERYLGDARRAGEIFSANQSTLSDPRLLPIGAELRIPDRPAARAANGDAAPGAAPATPYARLLRQRAVAPHGGRAPNVFAGP